MEPLPIVSSNLQVIPPVTVAAAPADGKKVVELCCQKGTDDAMQPPKQLAGMQVNSAFSFPDQQDRGMPPHATGRHMMTVDSANDVASALPAQMPRHRSLSDGDRALSRDLAPDTFFKPKQASFSSKSRDWSFTSRKSCNV